MKGVIVKPVNKSKVKVLPVDIQRTRISGFFDRYLCTNRSVSIPSLYRQFEKHGTIDNFRIVAGLKDGEINRRLATDSDFYKWMEAISWDQQNYYDEKRDKFLDKLISLVDQAQEPSGYINTFYSGDYRKFRFKNLEKSHELYCGGHLIQAAIAHYRSTGKGNFINIAIKWADYIYKRFAGNKIQKNDGHPEVEMALIELYRATGNNRYIHLAEFLMSLPYVHNGNKSFLQMDEVNGHAVRMMYLLSGASDYYIETGDERYLDKIRLLWNDLLKGKYYITGGVGSRYFSEAFGYQYELPNLNAYCESCASIALMMWLFRMFLIEPDARCFDLFETVLYNSFLSSISLNGEKYFYVNPLASKGGHERKQWYQTMCCPPNIQRFFSSLPGYFYAAKDNEIWVNLYDRNNASIDLGENTVNLSIDTDYPWNGNIVIQVNQNKNMPVCLHMRIPSWSNGSIVEIQNRKFYPLAATYFTCSVSGNSKIKIHFNMKSRFYTASPKVESDRNCVVIKRGPIVYCMEGTDNQFDIFNFYIYNQALREKRKNWENSGNFIEISGRGLLEEDKHMPYYEIEEREFLSRMIKFTAIPYFLWANRTISEMNIWFPYIEKK
ncbi:MAG TPA: glycoside hydrolase family 127 protein [Candidatus Ratteibacteria bacterium]|nr:glycoside hydrolase family 127 protein [Candidatus Ratteibacteria bacterium]HRV04377.1 glycoside hydrolase family 127 protein [Candidatus Ratteibacteria bacterium]